MAKQKRNKKRACVSLYFNRIEGSRWTYNLDKIHISIGADLPILKSATDYGSAGPKELVVLVSKVPFKGCSKAEESTFSGYYCTNFADTYSGNRRICKKGIGRSIRHCTNWSPDEVKEFLTGTLYFKAYEFEHAVTFG